MYMYNGVLANEHCYGASNSFNGFKNSFDQILDRENLRKLYIIKGGPGTGKSTMLKKLISSIEVERKTAIWCSSDPKSLDGILLECNGVRIGIVDGTAPHEMNPHIPGVTDEIIDLGKAFNIARLENMSQEIIDLGKIKSYSYRIAYQILSLAGKIWGCIRDVILNYKIYSGADLPTQSGFDAVLEGNRAALKRTIISSFSKSGYSRILPDTSNKKLVEIPFQFGLGCTILEELKTECEKGEGVISEYISPLDSHVLEGFSTGDTVYLLCLEYDKEDSSEIPESIRHLYSSLNIVLEYAAKKFAEASEVHFRLEKIYSQSVDFKQVDDTTSLLIDKISKLIK